MRTQLLAIRIGKIYFLNFFKVHQKYLVSTKRRNAACASTFYQLFLKRILLIHTMIIFHETLTVYQCTCRKQSSYFPVQKHIQMEFHNKRTFCFPKNCSERKTIARFHRKVKSSQYNVYESQTQKMLLFFREQTKQYIMFLSLAITMLEPSWKSRSIFDVFDFQQGLKSSISLYALHLNLNTFKNTQNFKETNINRVKISKTCLIFYFLLERLQNHDFEILKLTWTRRSKPTPKPPEDGFPRSLISAYHPKSSHICNNINEHEYSLQSVGKKL